MYAISEVPTQNDRPLTPVKVTSVHVGLPSGAVAAGSAAAPAATPAQPSASTPAGISWADKESKDW